MKNSACQFFTNSADIPEKFSGKADMPDAIPEDDSNAFIIRRNARSFKLPI